MNATDRTFADINIGDTASFTRAFTDDDIAAFAALSGDTNPLHTDPAYAATTEFKKPLVHGMLAASLFSTLLGMHLPGKRCLYLSQTLAFRKPIYAAESLIVSGTVTHKSEAMQTLELSMSITRSDETVVDGVAHVRVLS